MSLRSASNTSNICARNSTRKQHTVRQGKSHPVPVPWPSGDRSREKGRGRNSDSGDISHVSGVYRIVGTARSSMERGFTPHPASSSSTPQPPRYIPACTATDIDMSACALDEKARECEEDSPPFLPQTSCSTSRIPWLSLGSSDSYRSRGPWRCLSAPL